MKKMYHRWVTICCLSASAISLFIVAQYQTAPSELTGQLSLLALVLVLLALPFASKVIRKKI